MSDEELTEVWFVNRKRRSFITRILSVGKAGEILRDCATNESEGSHSRIVINRDDLHNFIADEALVSMVVNPNSTNINNN